MPPAAIRVSLTGPARQSAFRAKDMPCSVQRVALTNGRPARKRRLSMAERVFLGMLTPSSNTILEPVTTAMVAGLPEVTAHFSRFKVTEIALSGPALAQFDDSEILSAAELLAHAKVDVLAWNGTASGWLGFERDVQLCERITDR